VYPKNQIEQAKPKIMIASTATEIRAFVDIDGSFAPDDRRVYSVTPTNEQDLFYLLGILNAPPATYLIRKTARPKSGGFYDIETQFLAPLPIPDATQEDRAEVSRLARELQELHTQRRDLVEKLDRRLNSPQTAPLTPAPKPDWLWSDIGTVESWKKSREGRVPHRPLSTSREGQVQPCPQSTSQFLEGRVPPRPQRCKSQEWSGATPTDFPPASPTAALTGRALTAWAKQRHAVALQDRLDELDALLQPGVTLTVENTGDELALRINDREVLRLYDRPDTPFIAAQWRHTLRDANVTEAYDGKRLLKNLLTLRTTTDTPLRDRILALDAEITTLNTTIATRETALNTIIFRLYRLTPEEIATVEAG